MSSSPSPPPLLPQPTWRCSCVHSPAGISAPCSLSHPRSAWNKQTLRSSSLRLQKAMRSFSLSQKHSNIEVVFTEPEAIKHWGRLHWAWNKQTLRSYSLRLQQAMRSSLLSQKQSNIEVVFTEPEAIKHWGRLHWDCNASRYGGRLHWDCNNWTLRSSSLHCNTASGIDTDGSHFLIVGRTKVCYSMSDLVNNAAAVSSTLIDKNCNISS